MIFEFENLNDEQKWSLVKQERNKLLALSDWTQILDAPMSTEQREAWGVYRQALRDVPQVFSNPDDVVFPETPQSTP